MVQFQLAQALLQRAQGGRNGAQTMSSISLAVSQTSVCTELAVKHQVFMGATICKAQGCTTIASFGIAEQSPEFCKAHKQEGMVRTVTLGASI
jgi:hypothetical protein